MKSFLKLLLIIITLLISGCKMWPVSVGIFNKSSDKVQIELFVHEGLNTSEIFPLMISQFDSEYADSAFRNINPLKIDTVETGLKTVYHLFPGECLTIASYWDDKYRGFAYYQSPDGLSKNHHQQKLLQVIVRHPGISFSGSPEELDGLVKSLNPKKKVWGVVIQNAIH